MITVVTWDGSRQGCLRWSDTRAAVFSELSLRAMDLLRDVWPGLHWEAPFGVAISDAATAARLYVSWDTLLARRD